MAFKTLFLLEFVSLLLHHIPQISSNQFEEIISSSYFVDKTPMIKTLFKNCKNTPYVMITCPKLFGKSTNLDMVKRFAEIEVDQTTGIIKEKKETSSYHLFTNKSLKIAQHKNLVTEHLAEYPVILLNLRIDNPLENLTFEKFLREIRTGLKKTTERFKWLSDQLIEKNSIEKNPKIESQINFIEKLLNENLTVDEITSSLLQLTEILYEYFQKKVIVLIDDYDAVINGAILTPKYNSDRIIKIVKSMIGTLLEPKNPYVKFAVITGVNGILYNFHFLEMKTISHHRFLSCPLFSFYFGFTNEEVDELLDRMGINQRQSERDEVAKYFNGYFALGNLPIRTTASKKLLFNPYSVTSYLADVAKYQNLKNFSYWTTAEPKSDFLLQFMKASEFRKFLLELVHEKIIFVKHMHNYYENELVAFKNLVDRDFADISSFDVLTCLALLFEYGYLSYTSKMDFYRVPNKEIELDIQKYLSLWYKKFTNVSEDELASIGSNLVNIINLNDPPVGKWDKFIEASNRAFKSMVSTKDEYMPKRGGLQFELRAILYLAAIKHEQFEIGEKFEHDFYENYPDTAKFVVINDRGTALIVLIMYEDNETLQEAVKYVKDNKSNVKQTITCKKILSVNLLSDWSWETDYEVLFLHRDGYDGLAEQI